MKNSYKIKINEYENDYNDYNFKHIKEKLYWIKENAKMEYITNPTNKNFNSFVEAVDDYYTFIRIHDSCL